VSETRTTTLHFTFNGKGGGDWHGDYKNIIGCYLSTTSSRLENKAVFDDLWQLAEVDIAYNMAYFVIKKSSPLPTVI
jgi:hypothetical protein